MTIEQLPSGDLLVVPETSAPSIVETSRLVRRAAERVRQALQPADLIVGGRSFVVSGVAPSELAALLSDASSARPEESSAQPARHHEIPVCYDGADLPSVARLTGLSAEQVISLHAARRYECLVRGFLPGFAYLAELDPSLQLPRLANPRLRVPAGSVAIAGSMTGVYPSNSPGGWHLIGSARPDSVFDPAATSHLGIAPGDSVSFVAVAQLPVAAESPAGPQYEVPVADLEITRTALATVQDLGRRGHRGQGLPDGGAIDPEALQRANAAVGNPAGAAGIEVLGGRFQLRARRPLWLSLDGAAPIGLAAGEPFEVVPERSVHYLAFRGGIEVPAVAGSRSTLLAAGIGGLGGRSLKRGDPLGLGRDPGSTIPSFGRGPPAVDLEAPLEIARWPLDPRLPPDAFEQLLAARCQVSPTWDRLGMRLCGFTLARTAPDRALPEPVFPGVIQVATDGSLIVLGPDAAVTGGYPVVAQLTPAARSQLARRPAGAPVRFGTADRAGTIFRPA